MLVLLPTPPTSPTESTESTTIPTLNVESVESTTPPIQESKGIINFPSPDTLTIQELEALIQHFKNVLASLGNYRAGRLCEYVDALTVLFRRKMLEERMKVLTEKREEKQCDLDNTHVFVEKILSSKKDKLRTRLVRKGDDDLTKKSAELVIENALRKKNLSLKFDSGIDSLVNEIETIDAEIAELQKIREDLEKIPNMEVQPLIEPRFPKNLK